MVAGRLRVLLSFFALSLSGAAAAQDFNARAASGWDWHQVSGTSCRDGSETGFFLRQRPLDRHLVIYFEGGGSCFNSVTCLANPKNVGDRAPGTSGIFQERDDNPVNGWNFAYLPYCSGDIFAGTAKNVSVPGVSGKQNFTGYTNTLKILDQIKQLMPQVETILVTGISAGGYGAIFHFPTTKERWPESEVVLLDDSGIPLEDEWLAPCMQRNFRPLWGMEAAVPADCAACRGEDGGGLVNLTGYLKERYPDSSKGIIMSLQDSTMRFFYGFGLNECKPIIPNMAGARFEAGVRSLRDNYLKDDFPSFVQKGTQHVYISGKSFYETKAGGQNLASWVQDLLDNRAVSRGP